MVSETIEQVIAGALFDFAGHLTSMDEPATFSSRHDAAPAVKLLSDWAARRGLSLDEARVKDWAATLRQAARVDEVGTIPATLRKLAEARPDIQRDFADLIGMAAALEAALSAQPALVFADNGDDIERRMAYDAANACPHCGGSGHKDDAQPAERQGEIHQYRHKGSSDWYDGVLPSAADRDEFETRTLYTHPAAPVGVPDGTCSRCNGTGEYMDYRGNMSQMETCYVCDGSGKAAAPSAPQGEG
jgi:hypothetical protein